jgi:hypothetical protein
VSPKAITLLTCTLWLLLLTAGAVTGLTVLALLPIYGLIPIADSGNEYLWNIWTRIGGVILASLAITSFALNRKAVALPFLLVFIICTVIGFVRLWSELSHVH